MAKSTIKEVTEMRPVVVGKEIVLTLTEAEASTLASVLINIAGNPSCTARRYTDSVFTALDDAGVRPMYGGMNDTHITGIITFKPDSDLKGD